MKQRAQEIVEDDGRPAFDPMDILAIGIDTVVRAFLVTAAIGCFGALVIGLGKI
jgi:hypothetical protein